MLLWLFSAFFVILTVPGAAIEIYTGSGWLCEVDYVYQAVCKIYNFDDPNDDKPNSCHPWAVENCPSPNVLTKYPNCPVYECFKQNGTGDVIITSTATDPSPVKTPPLPKTTTTAPDSSPTQTPLPDKILPSDPSNAPTSSEKTYHGDIPGWDSKDGNKESKGEQANQAGERESGEAHREKERASGKKSNVKEGKGSDAQKGKEIEQSNSGGTSELNKKTEKKNTLNKNTQKLPEETSHKMFGSSTVDFFCSNGTECKLTFVHMEYGAEDFNCSNPDEFCQFNCFKVILQRLNCLQLNWQKNMILLQCYIKYNVISY